MQGEAERAALEKNSQKADAKVGSLLPLERLHAPVFLHLLLLFSLFFVTSDI